jgi:hypothetical protein
MPTNAPSQEYTFGLNYFEIIRRMMFGLAGITLAFTVFPVIPNPPMFNWETLIPFGITIAMAGFGVYLVFTSLYNFLNNPRYTLSKNGIMLNSLVSKKSWTWDEVDGVRGGLTHHKLYGFATLYVHGAYSFYTREQKLFEVSNFIRNGSSFYDTVCKQIMRIQHAVYYNRIQRGETIKFGNLSLNKKALYIGKNEMLLDNIKGVQLSSSVLFIFAKDKKSAWKALC